MNRNQNNNISEDSYDDTYDDDFVDDVESTVKINESDDNSSSNINDIDKAINVTIVQDSHLNNGINVQMDNLLDNSNVGIDKYIDNDIDSQQNDKTGNTLEMRESIHELDNYAIDKQIAEKVVSVDEAIIDKPVVSDGVEDVDSNTEVKANKNGDNDILNNSVEVSASEMDIVSPANSNEDKNIVMKRVQEPIGSYIDTSHLDDNTDKIVDTVSPSKSEKRSPKKILDKSDEGDEYYEADEFEAYED